MRARRTAFNAFYRDCTSCARQVRLKHTPVQLGLADVDLFAQIGDTDLNTYGITVIHDHRRVG